MPDPSPSSEYQMIREEIRSEHSLIANRLTWYVTSQSFLVTAFAISRGNGFAWFAWFSTLLLPLIGLISSALIFPSILGASATITLWHLKQREFCTRHCGFQAAFGMDRPSWVERRGLLFPQVMPLLFGSAWLAILVGSRFWGK